MKFTNVFKYQRRKNELPAVQKSDSWSFYPSVFISVCVCLFQGGVRDHLKSLHLREALINLEDEEENATTTITPQPITGQHCQYSVSLSQ